MKQRRGVWFAIASTLLVSSGCGSADGAGLDVFAASSLTNAFTELADEYEARSGVSVRLNFAGSSALREQIVDGASADIFASANESVMDALVSSGAVAGQVSPFATNRLVLAAPSDNPGNVTGLADLERSELFVGVCAGGVPCGDLAAATLAAASIAASVDTYEPNVRSLTNRLIDGELDVALVYATDVVAAGDALEVVMADVGEAAVYPIAALDGDDAAAQDFVDFVRSEAGQAILRKWGFAAP